MEEFAAKYLYNEVCLCLEYVQNQWHVNEPTFIFVYNDFFCQVYVVLFVDSSSQ